LADELVAGASAGSRGPGRCACQNRRWCPPRSRGSKGKYFLRVRILYTYGGLCPCTFAEPQGCGPRGVSPAGFWRRASARPPAPRGVFGTLWGCLGRGPGARSPCAKSIGRAGPFPGGFDRLPQDSAGRSGATKFGIRNVEFGILCFLFCHSAFRTLHSAFKLPARSMKWKPPHGF